MTSSSSSGCIGGWHLLYQTCVILQNQFTDFSETTHYAEFGNAHNIAVNTETGYVFVVGQTQRVGYDPDRICDGKVVACGRHSTSSLLDVETSFSATLYLVVFVCCCFCCCCCCCCCCCYATAIVLRTNLNIK